MDTFEGIPCHEVTKYLYEFYVWYKSNCTFRTYFRSVSNKKSLTKRAKKLYMKLHGNMSEI